MAEASRTTPSQKLTFCGATRDTNGRIKFPIEVTVEVCECVFVEDCEKEEEVVGVSDPDNVWDGVRDME